MITKVCHKFLLLFFSCISILSGQTPEKKNIAVINLESSGGLSQTEVVSLTDRLRSQLVNTNAFNVIERGKMDEILKEVGFQQTGCTTAECAVEVGKILNVQQMVTGAIGKVGNLFTVDIRVVDVSTTRIVKSFTRDYRGEIEGLVDAMGSIADQLARPGEVKTTGLIGKKVTKGWGIGIKGAYNTIHNVAQVGITLNYKWISFNISRWEYKASDPQFKESNYQIGADARLRLIQYLYGGIGLTFNAFDVALGPTRSEIGGVLLLGYEIPVGSWVIYIEERNNFLSQFKYDIWAEFTAGIIISFQK